MSNLLEVTNNASKASSELSDMLNLQAYPLTNEEDCEAQGFTWKIARIFASQREEQVEAVTDS